MNNSISIIIPTYNRAGLVGRSVASALAAISPGDEIIVVDDGSTDDTASTLLPYRDKIRYIRTENVGPGAARNTGIDAAGCPLVAFLDSDDEWLPDKIYLQRKVMTAFPKIVFCFTDLLSRHQDGQIYHKVLKIWENDHTVGRSERRRDLKDILDSAIPFSSIAALPEGRPDFNVHIGDMYAALMEVYYVWTCTIVVRKEAAGNAFLFREDKNIFEDWECFGRLAKTGPAAYLDCETAVQNVHGGTRLTDLEVVQKCTARIELLHCLWGADKAFMRAHFSRFQSVLHEHYRMKVRYLLKEGRTGEAWEDLKIIGGGPWAYRLLTHLPASLVRLLIGVRRRIKKLADKAH